jgi:hypothetical protein
MRHKDRDGGVIMQDQFVAAGAGVAGVGCACCGQAIALGDMITDRKVMKGGELAYIELVHQGGAARCGL